MGSKTSRFHRELYLYLHRNKNRFLFIHYIFNSGPFDGCMLYVRMGWDIPYVDWNNWAIVEYFPSTLLFQCNR